ncbi:Glycerophosphoryl diester phosphodiesterase family [Novymonas esmeraldas]|uniref:Glycerophosphoryl diester phosphodiesterase family n=1 Tax=Novymonas esmeraldas TaxID=1808958 RepID=A0AAW0EV54_9TRYP
MKSALLLGSVSVALGWSYVRHVQLPMGPSRLLWGGVVFGHRGCRNVAGTPENTLEAFRYAAERGCGGIECDVRLTKDNELVIFHDAFANGHLRNVPPTQRIDELTLFQLRECSFTADPTAQVRVPTLEEAILLCREGNMRMLIEIKELRRARLCTDKVLDLYRRYPDYMYDQTTLISFHSGTLYHARTVDKRIAVCQLYAPNLVTSWIEQGVDTAPWLLRLSPALWNRVILFVQERIVPWVAGCSMVGPRYDLFTDASRKRWTTRGICMYLWGFEGAEQCTPAMRQPGVCVSGDDHHEGFETPRPAPNYDIFGDRQRELERQQEEEYKRLRIGK